MIKRLQNIQNRRSLSIIPGLLFIFVALIVDEFVLARFLSLDGNIDSQLIKYSILTFQATMLCVGLYWVIFRPSGIGYFVYKSGSGLLLSFISIILMLLLAEFALRKISPNDLVDGVETLIAHPTRGWAKKPNTRFVNDLPLDKSSVQVSYNSQGWRDVEHRQENPNKIFRILILGDSYMEGTSVKQENIFPRQLKNLAKDAGYVIEVISMAVGAYGTLQEYLVFQESGQAYSPDLVLLGFHAMNDVQNNGLDLHRKIGSKASIRPFLDTHGTDSWHIVPVDFKRSQLQVAASQKRNQARNAKFKNESVLLRLLRTALNPPKQMNDIALLDWLGVSFCEEPAEYSSAWTATTRILTRLHAEIKSGGGQLVVFNVPALVEVDPNYMSAAMSRTTHPEYLCLEQAPHTARLHQVLTKLGVVQIDLLPAFRQATRELDAKLYMHSDQHWSPAGHTLAAKRVFSSLIQRGLLPVNSH